MTDWLFWAQSAGPADAQRVSWRVILFSPLSAVLLGLLLLVAGAALLSARRTASRHATGFALLLIGAILMLLTAGSLEPGRLIAVSTVVLAVGLFTVLQGKGPARIAGMAIFGLGVLFLISQVSLPLLSQLGHLSGVVFWLLASVLLLAALGTVSSRDPIYSAIWFALVLLATGAIMLIQGAQFLGIATVAVYAGAIVVTFLFVLMLAQPEGRSFYDRTSWGRWPVALTSGSAALLAGLVVLGLSEGVPSVAGPVQVQPQLGERIDQALEELQPALWQRTAIRVAPAAEPTLIVTVSRSAPGGLSDEQRSEYQTRLQQAVADYPVPAAYGEGSWRVRLSDNDVSRADHVAVFGRNLFGRHLVAVELAGILLFLALVGAIAMSAIEPPVIDQYAGRI